MYALLHIYIYPRYVLFDVFVWLIMLFQYLHCLSYEYIIYWYTCSFVVYVDWDRLVYDFNIRDISIFLFLLKEKYQKVIVKNKLRMNA